MSKVRRPHGYVPGYMTEDLELRQVSGPLRYTSRTNGPVEHIALVTTQGELMGYIYANDEDAAAGWQAAARASPDAQNLAAPWIRMLHDAKKRGLKPSAALDEMRSAVVPHSHVVPGSRKTSASLDVLKKLAGSR
jgi:hypothetical protein